MRRYYPILERHESMHQRIHSDSFLAFQLTLGSLQKGTDPLYIILLDFFYLQTFQPTEFMGAINSIDLV